MLQPTVVLLLNPWFASYCLLSTIIFISCLMRLLSLSIFCVCIICAFAFQKCCDKNCFFFSCMIESEQFSALFEAFFSFLKTEWELQSAVVSGNEVG